MVKEFELDPFADIWLVLDLDQRIMAGSGVESVEEYAVTICASLAKYFLDENRAVGFAAQGLHLSPDRGTRQLLKIYEVLAFVRPVRNTSLEELLVAEQRRFSRTDTIVVVTASREDGWVSLMRSLTLRGVHGQSVLLDPSTFGRGVPSRARAPWPAGGGAHSHLRRQARRVDPASARGPDHRRPRRAGVSPACPISRSPQLHHTRPAPARCLGPCTIRRAPSSIPSTRRSTYVLRRTIRTT